MTDLSFRATVIKATLTAVDRQTDERRTYTMHDGETWYAFVQRMDETEARIAALRSLLARQERAE